MSDEVVLRFNDVSFEYVYNKPILDEANFSVRNGSKITLMGQNGAGKSTIFSLIRGEIKPTKGIVSVSTGATVGSARQVMAREDLDLNVEQYFAKAFNPVPGNLKSQISKVLEVVNLVVPMERRVGDLSGGQQARLLLAFALIQNPDILLLDEPTNNLDTDGINHLINFLIAYPKTVLVISHDADFLNCLLTASFISTCLRKKQNYTLATIIRLSKISRPELNAKLKKMRSWKSKYLIAKKK